MRLRNQCCKTRKKQRVMPLEPPRTLLHPNTTMSTVNLQPHGRPGSTLKLHYFYLPLGVNTNTSGREQFHGLGSMYCRGAAAVILTYDVTNWQSLAELEERFLSLTDTANHDCIYAIVGNKADLTDSKAQLSQASEKPSEDQTECEDERTEPQEVSACPTPPASPTSLSGVMLHKQVGHEDAIALYGRILRYKGLDEKSSLPAEKMCFETSAKTGYNVDALFETLFDLVLPSILRKRNENQENPTVDLEDYRGVNRKKGKSACC